MQQYPKALQHRPGIACPALIEAAFLSACAVCSLRSTRLGAASGAGPSVGTLRDCFRSRLCLPGVDTCSHTHVGLRYARGFHLLSGSPSSLR